MGLYCFIDVFTVKICIFVWKWPYFSVRGVFFRLKMTIFFEINREFLDFLYENDQIFGFWEDFLKICGNFLRSKIFVVILSLSRKHLTIKEVVKWLFWVPWCSENHKESLLISYLSKIFDQIFDFFDSQKTLDFENHFWIPMDHVSHTVYCILTSKYKLRLTPY